MDTYFRPANDDDLDAIYQIEINSHIIPWSQKILRDCLHVGYDFQVICAQNKIVGYAITRYKDDIAHLLNLCIAKKYQSQGYGRKLLEHVINQCHNNNGICKITLEVRPSNKRALQLYQSLDFETSELREGYYNIGEHQEDALVLIKQLKPTIASSAPPT